MFPFQKYKLYRSQSITETKQSVKKKLGIVTSEGYTDGLNSFLGKILGAIHFDMNECEICEDESKLSQFEKILNFDGGRESVKYAFQDIGGTKMLFADGLEKIKNSKELKMLLWNALKKEFEV